MKRFLNIYVRTMVLCLSAWISTACVQDDFDMPGNVVEGQPVTVSMKLEALPETEIVVTRADNSFSHLYNLTLFVYSGDGNIFQQMVSTSDKTLTITRSTSDEDGVLYLVANFQTTSGIKKLLGVANASFTNTDGSYWASLKDLADKAKAGNLTFDELKSSVIRLREGLGENIQPIEITSSDQMLMSGWNESVVFGTDGTVTNYGTNVGNKDVILRLDRSMARITFNIPYTAFDYTQGAVNKIFTPTSYRVYNVPVNSYLGNIGEPPVTEGEDAFQFINYAEANVESVSSGNYSFTFYMPENVYGAVTEEGLDSYHDRDKWNSTGHEGATPEDKSAKSLWTYAPATSTFVVIKGTYEQTGVDKEYTGTVEYTIHLGDFSPTGQMGNYSVERNCSYTYTVKVLNVENIVVEAQKDSDEDKYQQGSEGSIYDYTQSDYAYHLDAHYEQVYLQYNLSDIAKTVKSSEDYSWDNVDEAIANALVLTIQSEAMDYEHPETEAEPYSVHNKRGTLKPYQIYVDAGGDTNKDAATAAKEAALKGKRDGKSGFDYKWVEFWPQAGTTIAQYPGVSDWSRDEILGTDGTDKLLNDNVYGGDDVKEDAKKLMDVYDVIVAMGKVIKTIIQAKEENQSASITTGTANDDGIIITTVYDEKNSSYDYVARFTAFVNEYYYYRHPLTDKKITSWSLFTNKMPREMIVALSTSVSTDGNSTYSVLYSYISQLSIQTFYNSRNAKDINGFGIETYNETPLTTFGTYKSATLTRTDGRQNQLNLIHAEPTTEGGYWGTKHYYWNTYINNSKNGWTEPLTSVRTDHVLNNAYNKPAAYVACLSRNRDLNGNGEIEDEEIRWYLPSLNEYIRIGIGARAISNAAQLYTGDKQNIGHAIHSGSPEIYPLEDIDEGTLYYTSSGTDARVYWAVEKGSYSATGNDWAGEGATPREKPIRCIRLLPGTGKDENRDIDISTADVDSDPTFEYDANTRTLTFSDRLVESLYRERVSDRLVAHNEDDAANRFYRKIVVAKENANGTFQMGQIIRLENYSDENPCANYHEDDDGGATWRVPNLVEFSAMHAVEEEKLVENGHACCTQFSNQNVRYGFRINENQIQAFGGGVSEYLNNLFYVRCVRDVD